jgi:CubicO group peptidase (beta-lactamase class C family)
MQRRPFTIALAALPLAACSTPGARDSSRVAVQAGALMQDLAARKRFQGAVVVGRGDQVQYAAGFGHADVEQRVPFTPDTPADGGSIAKTFTAALLLTLAHDGRLDLDARVRSIVPAYPHAATRVRHLLAHSTGLPDYEWFDARVPPGEPRTNAMHLAMVAREAPEPAFVPGSAYSYDNVAYDAAAMVAQQVTGRTYAQLIAERCAKPLGMDSAFVRPARFADWSGVRTRGYRRDAQGALSPHDAFDLEGFHGGGNLYLSARDLWRWAAGYRRAVPQAAYRAAMAPARLDDGRSTGLSGGSWYVSADRTRRYYTGHHQGFHCVGYADDAQGLALAWIANDAPPAWLQPALTRALIAVAEGRAPERLVAPPPVDAHGDPTGRYAVPQVGDVAVHRDGPLLRVRLRGVDYQGFPVARGVHYVPGIDAYLRFAAAPGGAPVMHWDSVYSVAPVVPRQ